MYLTTHASVGVLISQGVERPLWVFVFSFLSHFILDIIPHGDDDGERKQEAVKWVPNKMKLVTLVSIVDLALLAVMLLILYGTKNLPDTTRITAGIIGAVVPDLISSAFPVIHYYTSWFFLVRLYTKLQHKIGLTLFWRGHDWLHRRSHNSFNIRVTYKKGLFLQACITAVAFLAALGIFYSQ